MSVMEDLVMKARAQARRRRNQILTPVEDLLVHPWKARQNLIDFTRATYIGYKPDPFHYFVADLLGDVINGKVKRLMLFAPPQHGKTELISKRFPAFWFGHRPDDPIISTSYSGDRAMENGEVVRDILSSEEYGKIFPKVRLRDDSRKKDMFKLQGQRGYLRSAGVSGGITGLGTLLGIIDDPYASWEAATSETIRRKTEEWYRGTFRTRIWEGGAIVIIMTRWHQEDLAGWLMKEQPGQWKVVRLPAIAESQDERDAYAEENGLPLGEPDPLGRLQGEPLCPSRFSIEELERIRQEITPYFFEAEYQGKPRPMEGLVFKASWFENKIIPRELVPKDCQRIRYWDKAGTPEGGAHTVGILMARDLAGNLYVEDVVRGQWSSLMRENKIEEVAYHDWEIYGPGMVEGWVEQEPGSGGLESTQLTLKRLAKYGYRADKVTTAKGSRLTPFLAQCEAGNVHIVNAGWTQAYLAELLSWSESARIKDQADSSAAACNKLLEGRSIFSSDLGILRHLETYRGRD